MQRYASTGFDFAALEGDGSVVTWGAAEGGGDNTQAKEQLSTGVKQIFAKVFAFAALKCDGSVVTWGEEDCGAEK